MTSAEILDRNLPANLIVPRIVLDLPMVVKPDLVLSGDNTPVEQKLVADLSIAYAFDLPQCFRMVAQRDLVRLGLNQQSIHSLALTNLQERVADADILELDDNIFTLSCGRNNEAAMIVLDPVWTQAVSMVQGDLVVAVPSRDIVMFTGAENRDGLRIMRSRVSQLLEQGDHTLTRHFLIRAERNWRRYEGFAG